MRLTAECKKVAARVFPKNKDMFPGGLASMAVPPGRLLEAPIDIQADYMETNLEFLRELDQQPDTTVQSNTERQVCPQVEPQRPSAQMQLLSADPAPPPLATESEIPVPPASLMKPRWGKDKTSKLAEGFSRTCIHQYWRFCYTLCRSEQKAFQMAHLNRHFEAANPGFQGHLKWLENKETLLYLFHAARVNIEMSNKLLVKTLKKFWEERKVSLLQLLRIWFRSGAPDSILEGDVLHAALQHIRSEWKETDWWPNHGNNIDEICLTESVVTEDRLLVEWAACKQQRADYDYFRAEFETVHIALDGMLGAARTAKKLKTSGNISAIHALAEAAASE
jgi:hypothetical protein